MGVALTEKIAQRWFPWALRAGGRTTEADRTQKVLADIERTLQRRNGAFRQLEDTFDQVAARCQEAVTEVEGCRILGVSSAIGGEGKTTIALGLAASFAKGHQRDVLLVESDMRRPQLCDDFGLQPIPGLSEYLQGRAKLEAALQRTTIENLRLLPAGEAVANPSRLLQSDEAAKLFQGLRADFGTVIVDMPSLLESSEASLLKQRMDGVLLVVRAGVTPRRVVLEAANILNHAALCGVVLNARRSFAPGWLARILID